MKTWFLGWLIALGLWFFLAGTHALPRWILPDPISTAHYGQEHAGWMVHQARHTLYSMLGGAFGTLLLGLLLSLSFLFFPAWSRLMMPIMALLQSMPVLVMAPILMLLLGLNFTFRWTLLILMLLSPVTQLCYEGMRALPEEWTTMADIQQASRWRIFFYLRWPHALPSLGMALRWMSTTLPTCTLATEWMGDDEGLGVMMLQANAQMNLEGLWVGILCFLTFSSLAYVLSDRCLQYWRTRYG